jgi:hypothetical protein
VPRHALPPAEGRARNRVRRRHEIRNTLLVGLPWIFVSAIVRNGTQEHASLTYYLIAVPACAALIAAFAASAYVASRLAAVSVTRRPRRLYGLAAILYAVPVAIFVRIATEHIAAHVANDDSWAAVAGGILATLCTLGFLLMLGRAVVPGRWRRGFWLFPPLWLEHELDSASSETGDGPSFHGSGAPISG